MSSSEDDDEISGKSRSCDLERRLQEFRERKKGAVSLKKDCARCCQLSIPEDYNEYLDLQENLLRHGFSVVKGSLHDHDEVPTLQWGSYRLTAWELLFRGELVCNHFHMRSGLIRKAELCQLMSLHFPQCLPESHVATFDSPAARHRFIALVESLSQDGIWILKVWRLLRDRPPVIDRIHIARVKPV